MASSPGFSPRSLHNSLSWGSKYPTYQVDYTAVNAGRRLALTKRRVRWRFGYPSLPSLEAGKTGTDCRGEEHEVSLVWSLTSGKKSVVFDNVEVHSSESRQSVFEFSWSRDNQHVYKIVANAAGGGERQYDLHVDGQSYFDMPKVYELGTPNAGPRSRGLVTSVNERPNFSPSAPSRSPPAVVRPKNASQEEADLQRAIRESLAESEQHINRQKSHSFDHHHQHQNPTVSTQGHERVARARSNSNPEFDLLTMGVAEMGVAAPPQDTGGQWDPFGQQTNTQTQMTQQTQHQQQHHQQQQYQQAFANQHNLQIVTSNPAQPVSVLSPHNGNAYETSGSSSSLSAPPLFQPPYQQQQQQQPSHISPQGSQVDKAMKTMVNLDDLNKGNPFDNVMGDGGIGNFRTGVPKPSLKQLASSPKKSPPPTPVMIQNSSINMSLSGDGFVGGNSFGGGITPSGSNVQGSYVNNVPSGGGGYPQQGGYGGQQSQQGQGRGRMPFNSPAGPGMQMGFGGGGGGGQGVGQGEGKFQQNYQQNYGGF
ncbi:hypothetical protein TrST_g8804 [Triparma strigata]|uniref:Uncharacterized protein n=1 Tax=Triparma strigata TaxID=1606541 RepID=A0A9W7F1Y5_9STRA|nr:hypothetical protein TrST_g8804 [Triparma strigata]